MERPFFFDHCSRKEVVDPFICYTKDILACHERYLLQIRNNMHAPVEILYGIQTWERTQYLLPDKLQALDLWGSYEGIATYLEIGKCPGAFWRNFAPFTKIFNF